MLTGSLAAGVLVPTQEESVPSSTPREGRTNTGGEFTAPLDRIISGFITQALVSSSGMGLGSGRGSFNRDDRRTFCAAIGCADALARQSGVVRNRLRMRTIGINNKSSKPGKLPVAGSAFFSAN